MKFKHMIMTTAVACALLFGIVAFPQFASADFSDFGSSSSADTSSGTKFGTGSFSSNSAGFSSSAPAAADSLAASGSSAGNVSSESDSSGTAAVGGISSSGKTMGNSYAVVDAANASNGSIRVKYIGGGGSRIKVQIIKNSTYNYDLNLKGEYETFPMNMGSGTYTIKVMRNVGGKKYTAVYATNLNVQLTSEYAPYLTASQYVDYDTTTKVIKKAASLCKNKKSDLDKIDAIYEYVIDFLNYDTAKAKTVKSGYLPDLDSIYKSKKGICFDYASMLAAMLRSEGIPTKLVTGYVGSNGLYHAWNEVYTKETGWVKKVISFDGTKWKLMDPTFASSAHSSNSIMDFIANTSNYRIKYTY